LFQVVWIKPYYNTGKSNKTDALHPAAVSIAAALLALCIAGSAAISEIPMAFACSCAGPSPPSEALEESTAVFAGRVASIEPGSYGKTVRFDAERAWKGVTESAVTVTTGNGGGDCGYSFEQGKEYLVYAYGDKESLGTGICSRTQPIIDAYVDLAALGSGYAPSQSSLPAEDTKNMLALELAAAACAGIVGVVAFMMVKQWRKK
jgi:hypothetical protein